MVVLALDTATRQGSAAVLIDGRCDARAGDPSRTHGERLPGELLALLGAHDLAVSDVDRFAIVSGPGSFTGLRVGAASIQGLAFVTGRPVAPVPTLEAMAEGWRIGQASGPRPQASGKAPDAGGPRPEANVVVCLDGQRGDVFFAAWQMSPEQPVEEAVALIEPSVGTPEELVRQVRAAGWTSSIVVGIGLDRHASVLSALNVAIEPLRIPLAQVAATVAARRPEIAVTPHALRPLYIRRPDAVLARERAGL